MTYIKQFEMLLSDDIKEICRVFYQKASDNGTKLISYDWDEENQVPIDTYVPLIDCGISLFEKLKR